MTAHEFEFSAIDGGVMKLSDYADTVLLIVNVASRCGFTPQYKGLQKLHDQYGDKGFSVIGIPCNQFGAQEPGSEEEIREFCSTRFGVTFPMTAKVDVNGPNRHPFFAWVVNESDPAGDIRWNFEKFLVGKTGEIRQRWLSQTRLSDPDVKQAIEQAL